MNDRNGSEAVKDPGTGLSGKIIRGVGGIYYVHVPGRGLFACRARGIFRKRKIKPLPGDNVLMDITDIGDMEGSISEILPRVNTIIRPAAANVDQAMIIFAADHPAPNFNLLDRFLLLMERQSVETIICFNKADLVSSEKMEQIRQIYAGSGCQVLSCSVRRREGLDRVREALSGRTTIVAGPSGVGKSSLTNAVYPEASMQTGSISEKIGRGRHTTRHTELFAIGEDTYLMDTPGFSTIYIEGLEKENLKYLYPEFEPYINSCRFAGCNHLSEPGCLVKEKVAHGEISPVRYENYRLIFEELAARKPY